jgi:hypothetical protein
MRFFSKTTAICFIIWLVLLFLLSCDTDRFLGFKYSADKIPETAPVSGTVLNKFTDDPVAGARVEIGSQVTFTDSSGHFFLNYFLQADNQRDKPIPVEIIAKNYLPFKTSLIIYPSENTLNVELEYGAPIIEAAVQKDSICQAIILDYQGIPTLDSVSVTFHFWYPGVKESEVQFPLQLKRMVGNRGYYEVRFDTFIFEYGFLKEDNFLIYVHDKDGFETRKRFTTFNVQQLLF